MSTSTLEDTKSTRRYSLSETRSSRKAEHLLILDQLELLPLSDSCCEICHCDCYSSHRSSDYEEDSAARRQLEWPEDTNTAGKQEELRKRSNVKGSTNDTHIKGKDHVIAGSRSNKKKKKNGNTNDRDNFTLPQPPKIKLAKATMHKRSLSSKSGVLPTAGEVVSLKQRRSKSSSSLHKRTTNNATLDLCKYYTRDCEILQELFGALDATPKTEMKAGGQEQQLLYSKANGENKSTKTTTGTKQTAVQHEDMSSLYSHLPLCESMANLCLVPTVREAFQQVSSHDKKILNRMANKRSERVVAKEAAWLARKYWENERYERELFKYEQMEEYKRAVRDKQFQDFQVTKARLNELAQRDWAELQHLRDSMQEKEQHAKRRLVAARVERDIRLCQQRCDELRRCEAANVQQEEQQLDAALRKQEICQRLGERLQRAQQLRTRMLGGYLKRLQHDNYVEQLLHDEHWRETQKAELHKRELLKEHISQKSLRSQRFMANRQRRLEASTKTAKISASLRELVRNSVTPDTATSQGPRAVAGIGPTSVPESVPVSLRRLLHEKPITKVLL